MFRRLLIATVVGILAAFAVAGFRHAMLLLVWGSDQFWAELVQPGRTSKPCVARGVVI
ncbi:hypothetical protein E6P69_003250 [Escherichia coli]|nr:hypothetical protein [Escherichia coli]